MKTLRDELQSKFAEQFISLGFYGIMNLACRFGKTKTAINCLKKDDVIVIAYPEVNIKKSWTEDIKKFKFKGKNIKYTTFMSFKKLESPCTVLIIDEVHKLSQAQILSVKDYIRINNIKKVIGLSGTISLETEQNLLIQLKLPILVKYSISEAIKDGVISDYFIKVVFVPLSTKKDIEVKWKGGNFFTSEKDSFNHLSYKIENANQGQLKMLRLMRMGLIKKSKAKIAITKAILDDLDSSKKILVFSGLTESADSFGIPSYHSKNNNEKSRDAFLNGKINKLSIVNKMNAGVTFKDLDVVIISFFDSNAENMGQRISRVTNLDFKDKVAHIVIICSTEEIEKKWLMKSLSFFDNDKINFINP